MLMKFTFRLSRGEERMFMASVDAESGGQARQMVESMYSGHYAVQMFCEPVGGTMSENNCEKEYNGLSIWDLF